MAPGYGCPRHVLYVTLTVLGGAAVDPWSASDVPKWPRTSGLRAVREHFGAQPKRFIGSPCTGVPGEQHGAAFTGRHRHQSVIGSATGDTSSGELTTRRTCGCTPSGQDSVKSSFDQCHGVSGIDARHRESALVPNTLHAVRARRVPVTVPSPTARARGVAGAMSPAAVPRHSYRSP